MHPENCWFGERSFLSHSHGAENGFAKKFHSECVPMNQVRALKKIVRSCWWIVYSLCSFALYIEKAQTALRPSLTVKQLDLKKTSRNVSMQLFVFCCSLLFGRSEAVVSYRWLSGIRCARYVNVCRINMLYIRTRFLKVLLLLFWYCTAHLFI